MNKYSVTMVFLDGVFSNDECLVQTELSEFNMGHIVAQAFDIECYDAQATIVSPNVWQVTMNGGVFIVEKY